MTAELQSRSRLIRATLNSSRARQTLSFSRTIQSVKTAKSAIFVLTVTLFLVFAFASGPPVAGQKNKKPVIPVGPLLTRTITRHESRRFFYAGTVTVTGAPNGSITIEGWQQNKVEISAEIELQAATEADLSRLGTLNNFVVDEDANHLRVITTGTHDRTFMKRMAKDFPKSLIGLPGKLIITSRFPR